MFLPLPSFPCLRNVYLLPCLPLGILTDHFSFAITFSAMNLCNTSLLLSLRTDAGLASCNVPLWRDCVISQAVWVALRDPAGTQELSWCTRPQLLLTPGNTWVMISIYVEVSSPVGHFITVYAVCDDGFLRWTLLCWIYFVINVLLVTVLLLVNETHTGDRSLFSKQLGCQLGTLLRWGYKAKYFTL